MRVRALTVAVLFQLTLIAPLIASALPGGRRAALSIRQRIDAQRAIERIRYKHQVGATRPFGHAVPEAHLEMEVRDHLEKIAALARFWNIRITDPMLRAEAARIALETRLPERLRELHRALGDDVNLILECLVRPVLVDRLIQERYHFDPSIHADARHQAETLRERIMSGELDPEADDPRRSVLVLREHEAGSPVAGDLDGGLHVLSLSADQLRPARSSLPGLGQVGPVEEVAGAFIIRTLLEENPGMLRTATYTIPKEPWAAWWKRAESRLDARGAARIRSSQLPAVGAAPAVRSGPTETTPDARDVAPLRSLAVPAAGDGPPAAEVDCGSVGVWDNGSLAQPTPGPWAGAAHVAVWTGNLMLVWLPFQGTGGRYDPVLDSWSTASSLGAPVGLTDEGGQWTGEEMIVWSSILKRGGRYDPERDSWRSMSSLNAPRSRYGSTAVIADGRLIVWGGWDEERFRMECPSFNCPGFESDTGGIYDPQTDIWTTTSTTAAPAKRRGHTAVWTGRRMLIWGGYYTYAHYQAGPDPIVWYEHYEGGSYDPLTNTWEPLPSGLLGRTDHKAIWDGSRMLVWGGRHQNVVPFPFQITYEVHNDGAVYDEETRSWSLIDGPAPALPCCGNAAIWTGTAMLLWGGGATNDGALYDPVTASWIRTTQVQAPEPRTNFTAVWDGSGMIVWGGRVGLDYLDTGGRFLPVTRPENTDQDQDGFSPCQGDCNDANAAVHPEASEVCEGLDSDCDGSVPSEEQDADADGLSSCAGDCDDTNAAVHPGAADLPGDTVDENCDGAAACDPEDAWPSPGYLARCVVHECNELVDTGMVSRQVCNDLIRDAARYRRASPQE